MDVKEFLNALVGTTMFGIVFYFFTIVMCAL